MTGFSDPVAGGGGQLVRPSIHSPGYTQGSTGWSINKDGSAEFNNLTYRGTFSGTNLIINTAGAFFYNGTPGTGNLIASITPTGGTDQFGNAYHAVVAAGNQAGAYTRIGNTGIIHMQNASGADVLQLDPTRSALLMYSGTPAVGNLICSLASAAGTDALGNAFPQGLSVTTGTVQGTSISGSTFAGTNFLINTSGEFYYNGVPASGNLIASVAPASGTDAHGNNYLAGFTSYDNGNHLFVNMNGSVVSLGQIVSGTPDKNDAAHLLGGGGLLTLTSCVTASLPDGSQINLFSGTASTHTGSTNPTVQFEDTAGTSDCDIALTGTVIKAQSSGNNYSWQAASLAAGFVNISMRYRLDPEDNIVLDGGFTMTAAQASAGSATITSAGLAAPYKSNRQSRIPASWTSSSGVLKGSGMLLVNTDGSWSVQWASATAANDRFYVSYAKAPIGQIP